MDCSSATYQAYVRLANSISHRKGQFVASHQCPNKLLGMKRAVST